MICRQAMASYVQSNRDLNAKQLAGNIIPSDNVSCHNDIIFVQEKGEVDLLDMSECFQLLHLLLFLRDL